MSATPTATPATSVTPTTKLRTCPEWLWPREVADYLRLSPWTVLHGRQPGTDPPSASQPQAPDDSKALPKRHVFRGREDGNGAVDAVNRRQQLEEMRDARNLRKIECEWPSAGLRCLFTMSKYVWYVFSARRARIALSSHCATVTLLGSTNSPLCTSVTRSRRFCSACFLVP